MKNACRKSSGASLSKLNIGFWIQFSRLPKGIYIFLPLFYCFAALQKYWGKSMFCHHVCTEQSCRTTSDDHRSICRCAFRMKRELIYFLFHDGDIFAVNFFKHLFLLQNGSMNRIDIKYLWFFARVN